MTQPLPPLSAIRVFEAVARRLSFTRAAKELGMTQAAVSYQIKLLEERLGEPLFLRRPREIVLTEAGQRLAPGTSEAFELLRETFARFAEPDVETLTVNTMHTFAAQWLAPRLGAFQLRHPTLAVRLETTNRVVDFAREEVDIVVRAGMGQWPGLVATKLIDVHFTPMLSPALAETVGGIREHADILKLPLIDPADPWWISWLTAHGLPVEALKSQIAIAMGSQAIDASAAMAGYGVALLTPAYYRQELADGRLIQPFDEVMKEESAYWLAYPESRRNVPKIKAFRDWIAGEAAKEP